MGPMEFTQWHQMCATVCYMPLQVVAFWFSIWTMSLPPHHLGGVTLKYISTSEDTHYNQKHEIHMSRMTQRTNNQNEDLLLIEEKNYPIQEHKSVIPFSEETREAL